MPGPSVLVTLALPEASSVGSAIQFDVGGHDEGWSSCSGIVNCGFHTVFLKCGFLRYNTG